MVKNSDLTEKTTRPYSLLTLRPKSEEDRKLFWEVRCDDIAKALNIQMIFQVIFYLPNIGLYMQEATGAATSNLIWTTIYFFCFAITWLTGKRFKRALVYMVPFMYVSTNACLMQTAKTNFNSFEGLEKEEVRTYLTLYAGLLFLAGNFFCMVILLSPSSFFTMCIYLPISLISGTIYMKETSSFDNTLAVYLFEICTISSLWAILVFYILQLRAL